jgi:ABC-2 type transport system permease protein
MDEELLQAKIARHFGWLTPTTAIRSFSMMLAGTSLETHHRFLREAEKLRFDFVQSLNQIHQEDLDYKVDMNRHNDNQAARVSASNWHVLSEFSFTPDSASVRFSNTLPHLFQLLLWAAVIVVGVGFAGRRMSR